MLRRHCATVLAAVKEVTVAGQTCDEVVGRCHHSFNRLEARVQEGYPSYDAFRQGIKELMAGAVADCDDGSSLQADCAAAQSQVELVVEAHADAVQDFMPPAIPKAVAESPPTSQSDEDDGQADAARAAAESAERERAELKRLDSNVVSAAHTVEPGVVLGNPTFAEIVSFSRVFGHYFGLPFISLPDWEAMFSSGLTTTLCSQVHTKLLRGLNIVGAGPFTDWPSKVHKIALRYYNAESAFAVALEPVRRYHELLFPQRLQVTWMLCLAQLDTNKRFMEVVRKECKSAKTTRLTPVGSDHQGSSYWYFDDKPDLTFQLYRQTLASRGHEHGDGDGDGHALHCCAKNEPELRAVLAAMEKNIEGYKVDVGNCHTCKKNNNKAAILLCDGCDCEMHTFCAVPPLHWVPDGDWFCHMCEELKLATFIRHELESLDKLKAKDEQRKCAVQRVEKSGLAVANIIQHDFSEEPAAGGAVSRTRRVRAKVNYSEVADPHDDDDFE